MWKLANIAVIHHRLLEDDLDMTTEVEMYQEHVGWLREALSTFAGNWQTPDQQHGLKDEKLDIFSAGHEADPAVGIQNVRAGKSFSMIVRMPVIKNLIELLSKDIPELPAQSARLAKPASTTSPIKPSSPDSSKARRPDVKISRTECRDSLGNPAETIEVRCGEASYWDWSPEWLLAQLNKLQSRLTHEKTEDRKMALLLEDNSYLLPGDTAGEKEQVLTGMISQLERFMGIKRKKQ